MITMNELKIINSKKYKIKSKKTKKTKNKLNEDS